MKSRFLPILLILLLFSGKALGQNVEFVTEYSGNLVIGVTNGGSTVSIDWGNGDGPQPAAISQGDMTVTSPALDGTSRTVKIYEENLLVLTFNSTVENDKKIKSLKVNSNTIYSLVCTSNKDVTSLATSSMPNLIGLNLNGCGFTTLDLSAFPLLTSAKLVDVPLTSLNVSGNPALVDLNVSSTTASTNLTSLSLENNTALLSLVTSKSGIKNLDLSNNINLKTLECNESEMESLNLSANTKLETLLCQKNSLTSLDLSNMPSLKTLQCQENQLTSLDLSKSENLEYLWCHTNNLASLKLHPNHTSVLADLDIRYNYLTLGDFPYVTPRSATVGSGVYHLPQNGPVVKIKYKNDGKGIECPELYSSLDGVGPAYNRFRYYKTSGGSYFTAGFTNDGAGNLIVSNDALIGEEMYFAVQKSFLGSQFIESERFTLTGTPVGISDEKADEALVYPTVFSDYVTVTSSEGSVVTIFDITGKIFNQTILSTDKQEINLSALKNGMYILQIKNSDNYSSIKIIKQ